MDADFIQKFQVVSKLNSDSYYDSFNIFFIILKNCRKNNSQKFLFMIFQKRQTHRRTRLNLKFKELQLPGWGVKIIFLLRNTRSNLFAEYPLKSYPEVSEIGFSKALKVGYKIMAFYPDLFESEPGILLIFRSGPDFFCQVQRKRGVFWDPALCRAAVSVSDKNIRHTGHTIIKNYFFSWPVNTNFDQRYGLRNKWFILSGWSLIAKLFYWLDLRKWSKKRKFYSLQKSSLINLYFI